MQTDMGILFSKTRFKPSKEDPVIDNGHSTHTKNIAFMEMAVVCLPPRYSHMLQPLKNILISKLVISTQH